MQGWAKTHPEPKTPVREVPGGVREGGACRGGGLSWPRRRNPQ